jgi:TolA-binding protein
MNENSYIVAEFPTGNTVTIDIYKLSDNSKVVSAANMAEIGTTGIFKYQQTLNPIVLTEYLYIATDGIDTRKGKIVLGGYPDTITESQSNEESDITTIKNDVNDIKSDVSNIESDISTIKSDESDIKLSQSNTEADITTIKGSQTNEENDISDIKEDIATMQGDIEEIDDSLGVLTTGKGSVEKTYTLTESDLTPIADAEVRVTSDILGVYQIAVGRTNSLGQITFQLDEGSTVYLWRSKTGLIFTNPDIEVV